ncbi:hypothetical protein [Methylobacter sp.]|uniref:hypothetical protein n=1 Tax=Methylobacter sp. TaxID=2051955 RepID=UPI003DA40B72
MKKKEEGLVLEATLETSEVVLDALTTNEVLANIPIIGTALNIYKATQAVRDRAFVIKVERFARPISEAPDSDRQRFREKLQQNPEETKKVGETLFLVLDRLADVDKPTMLGYVFVSYLNGLVSYSDLRFMSQAIDMAYADDLELFLEYGLVPEKRFKEGWEQRLAAAGLTETAVGSNWKDDSRIYYRTTKLGGNLRIAYKKGKQGNG